MSFLILLTTLELHSALPKKKKDVVDDPLLQFYISSKKQTKKRLSQFNSKVNDSEEYLKMV